MINIVTKATVFLNVLNRIPKLMEQYRTENANIEKDLPTLREVVGSTWKKEEELNLFKSEMVTLEQKIILHRITSIPINIRAVSAS